MTRVFESNGPDIKIRGTASHVAEKYVQLARDARSSGDPVAAENYYQHAEHYFRLIAAAQEQFRQNQPQQRRGSTTTCRTVTTTTRADYSNFGAEPGLVPVQSQPQPYQPREQPQFQPREPRETAAAARASSAAAVHAARRAAAAGDRRRRRSPAVVHHRAAAAGHARPRSKALPAAANASRRVVVVARMRRATAEGCRRSPAPAPARRDARQRITPRVSIRSGFEIKGRAPARPFSFQRGRSGQVAVLVPASATAPATVRATGSAGCARAWPRSAATTCLVASTTCTPASGSDIARADSLPGRRRAQQPALLQRRHEQRLAPGHRREPGPPQQVGDLRARIRPAVAERGVVGAGPDAAPIRHHRQQPPRRRQHPPDLAQQARRDRPTSPANAPAECGRPRRRAAAARVPRPASTAWPAPSAISARPGRPA